MPTVYGLDLLGSAEFQLIAVQNFPKMFAYGTFTQTFGDAYSTVAKIAETGNATHIRLNLLYQGKVPGRRTYPTNTFPGIVREAARYARLAEAYPNIVWYFCGMTEHNSPSGEAQNLANRVLQVIPAAANYVNNPQQGAGALIPSGVRILNEVHGSSATPIAGRYIYSFDGNSCYNFNVTQLKIDFALAELFFFWSSRFNGKFEDEDSTPIGAREFYPSPKDIKSVAVLAEPEGVTNLPPNWLYKSHAENNGIGDPRAEKGLFIIPPRGKNVTLKTTNGKEVGSFYYYGQFIDGRARYYSTDYGYEIGARAAKIQNGDPRCQVWVGGNNAGIINPSFRIGSFQ